MRISDWSSDVCSSDLQDRGGRWGRERGRSGSCRVPLRDRQARDTEEVGEHRMTVLGGDAFGVELDAVDRQLAMAEPHDRAIVARRVDREDGGNVDDLQRSEEHTSELQSLMRISYAVFCLKKKKEKLI